MAHNHSHQHSASKGLTLAFWLNLIFSGIEFSGGIYTNSSAIMADAFHDFMDALAIGIAVLIEKISGKKRTQNYSYGYKRFSLLSAIIMSVMLLAGASLMIINAIHSFITPQTVNSTGMFLLAVLGLTINGFAFLRIKKSKDKNHHHEDESEHDDDHSHNHNTKAIMLHLLEDVLGWVAVLIGSVLLYFTGWNWIDPMLAVGIAIFIGYNAISNLIDASKVLLQAIPKSVNIQQLSDEIKAIEGIESIHDLHVWSLDGNFNVGTLHIVIHKTNSHLLETIMQAALQLLKKHHVQHPTLQLEYSGNECRFMNC